MKAGRDANTQEPDETETNKVRTALEDFLTCLGTYCPENFMFTVIKEATSYEWVLRRIHETFQLDNRGVNFLAGFKVKTESSEEPQAYQQRFQAFHEFYSSSLLKKGEIFEGKPLDKDETLTPFGKNIIVEKWLDDIHPELKGHIVQTRGSLFTEQRPNLSDNQKQLCEQMDTLLQEIEQKQTNPTVNRTWFAQPTRRRGQPPPRPLSQTRPPIRQSPTQSRLPARETGRCPPNMCYRCYEAGRFGPASLNHQAANCPEVYKVTGTLLFFPSLFGGS